MSELAQALAKVQAELPRIEKTETAQVRSDKGSYSYDYADLAEISSKIMPLLGKNGLAFTARPTMVDGRFVLAYSLLHASGEREDGEYPLPDRGTPQQLGGHITYGRRYCLCAITGVAPGGDDNDAAGATEISTDRPRRVKTAHSDPEHVRLVQGITGRHANGKPAERLSGTPETDPWLDQPAGQLPHETEPENRPGSIDGRQRSRLHAGFTALGIADRDQRLEFTAKVIGRAAESSNDLSWVEAEQVISELQTKLKLQAANAEGGGDGAT